MIIIMYSDSFINKCAPVLFCHYAYFTLQSILPCKCDYRMLVCTCVPRMHSYTAFLPSLEPLDAPAIIGTVVQDSSLTVVFSDTAQCSNSSWEVCVTVDGHHQTERCSSRSAEDRSMTVDDAGKGNVYSVRARVLYGDRHSPYSETTSLGATSVLPRGTVGAYYTLILILRSNYVIVLH